MGPPRRASLGGTALTAVGGLLLILSMFFPWTSSGIGSTQASHELADLLLAGRVGSAVPRWAGLWLYILPVCGALTLISTGLGGRRGPIIAAGSLAVATVAALLVSITLSWAPMTRPGTGAVLAVSGLIATGAGLAVTLRPPVAPSQSQPDMETATPA